MNDDWLEFSLVGTRKDEAELKVVLPVSLLRRIADSLNRKLVEHDRETAGAQGMTDWGDLGPAEEQRT